MVSTVGWSRSAINRAWAQRTLRILVSPRPITFAERRSVLQVLQDKCGIDVFKMVPGYPGQFLAVTRDEDSAKNLVSLSPLSYSIEAPRRSSTHDIQFMDLSRPELLDGTRPSILPADETLTTGRESSDDDQVGERQWSQQQERQHFSLRIVKVQDYNHAGTMDSSPLHGSWPARYTADDSFTSSVLKQTLPHNAAAAGLARWDYNLTLGHQAKLSPKNERLQVSRWLPGNMGKRSQGEGQNGKTAADTEEGTGVVAPE
ncbi:hypothetical protein GMORB2_0959 [Geosmithia morbida]|uniref:Uncharacterized protein n=1 Tax=Geosmithia morbida TaxID=1094350 RepID=A0A9P4YZD0_9HYPO|nr:uncharacterized protein GMORB2_0959 [Geosmithia morbida]KAF4125715.1 hypothetical protein GMORB2_0959 [Geosmithia morbida]